MVVPTPCYDVALSHTIAGQTITVTGIVYYAAPPGTGCAQVEWEWGASDYFGILPPGTYEVNVNIDGRTGSVWFTILAVDLDNDTVLDHLDNCPSASNPTQVDADSDGLGDPCDPDDDNDGVADGLDLCPGTLPGNPVDVSGCPYAPVDQDLDGLCNPGVASVYCTGSDNCPSVANPTQVDADSDGLGDACDPDDDNDGVGDALDLCPGTPPGNPVDVNGCPYAPVDQDLDGLCNPGVASIYCTGSDNCPTDYNPAQQDLDADAVGDACDSDVDNDGVLNASDLCPVVPGPAEGAGCVPGPPIAVGGIVGLLPADSGTQVQSAEASGAGAPVAAMAVGAALAGAAVLGAGVYVRRRVR